jgi:hypothetical protein
MQELHILFDVPPGPEAGRFVETEDENGKGVGIGEWKEIDGYWHLVIPYATDAQALQKRCEELEEALTKKHLELCNIETDLTMQNSALHAKVERQTAIAAHERAEVTILRERLRPVVEFWEKWHDKVDEGTGAFEYALMRAAWQAIKQAAKEGE